jgi:hypothetical protein
LNGSLLSEGYFAEEKALLCPMVETGVATFDETARRGQAAGGTATMLPRAWALSARALVVPAVILDAIEVLVFESDKGARLVAAIEFVSPANKDREAHRLALAVKCASYLGRGSA